MQLLRILPVLGLAFLLNACSSGIDEPKGSSKGYQSARFARQNPHRKPITDATEKKVHRMIQTAITSEFSRNGLAFNNSNADLVVSYLVIYQETGMTTYYDDYFGQGRSAEEILEVAHRRGVIEGHRPDYFERAGVVVDVIDARTNKLVYRNHATGDIVRGISDSSRAQRVSAAVNTALAGFFK